MLMNHYLLNINWIKPCTLLAITLFAIDGFSQTSQNYTREDSLSQEYKFLKDLYDDVNENLYLIADIAENLDLTPEESMFKSVEKIRINVEGCSFVENVENLQTSPEPVLLGEEYTIVDYRNQHYQIKYSEDQKLWIAEPCVEKFVAQERYSDVEMLFRININNNIKIARIAYNTIKDKQKKAAIFKKTKIDKLADGTSKKALLLDTYARLEEKISYADAIFSYYIEDIEQNQIPKLEFHKRLSLVSELSFGSSKFQTHYSEFLKDESKAGNTDVSLRGSYILNAKSKVNFNLAHRAESLQTSYKNTQLSGNYIASTDKINYSVSAAFNAYKDEFRDINSYDRINLSARATQQVADKLTMHYNVGLTNYNYKVDDNFDFMRQNADVRAVIGSGTNTGLQLRLQADASQSDLSTNNYIHLAPEIKISKNTVKGTTDITMFAERFDFQDIPQRSSDKLFLGVINRRTTLDGTNKMFEIHGFARVFPEGELNDFYQLLIGGTSNSYGESLKMKRSQLSLRYFPNNVNFSHADYFFDYGNYGRFYSAVNGNIRYWYPDETSFVSTDIYLKAGVQMENIRIGPVLGVHNNTDLKDSDVSFKSDKNNYRVGAEAQGNYVFAEIYRLDFRAAYEYGFNYNATVTSVSEFGEIIYGELVERHPSTIQLRADFSAPVHEKLELIANVQYYKLDTDITNTLSVNPIIGRDRLSFRIGLRMRYN